MLSSGLAIKQAVLISELATVWICRAFYVRVSSEDRNQSRKLRGQKRERTHAAFYCRQLGIIRGYYRICLCGDKKDKNKFASEQWRKEASVCVCLFLSCRSALMQHVFRPKHFTLFASSSQWDPPISSSRIWFETSVRAPPFLSVSLCV